MGLKCHARGLFSFYFTAKGKASRVFLQGNDRRRGKARPKVLHLFSAMNLWGNLIKLIGPSQNNDFTCRK